MTSAVIMSMPIAQTMILKYLLLQQQQQEKQQQQQQNPGLFEETADPWFVAGGV